MRDVNNLIGMSVSMVICAMLMYLLLKSFKDREIFSKMKISASLVFVTIILYDFCSLLRKSIIPIKYCVVREPLGLSPFLISRGALYYFFIIRMQLTFEGSGIQFPHKLIKGLKITTIAVYGSFAIYFVVMAYRSTYDAVDNDCSTDTPLPIYIAVMGIYALVDFVLGVIICSLYLTRLYALYKLVKISAVMDTENAIENRAAQKGNKELLRIIQKQGKLAYVSYISTLFLIYFGPPTTGLTMAYIDSVINAFCVYCTFNWNDNVYRYLCNCNGNKYLQYLFCSVCGCCCCNHVRSRSNDIELKTSTTNSTTDAKADSQTSRSDDGRDSKASSDTGTTTQIDFVLH
eukprot:663506_1